MKKLMVGNKCDLIAERIVDSEKAKVCNTEEKSNKLSLGFLFVEISRFIEYFICRNVGEEFG